MNNSLSAVHPELIVEWSDRNLPLTPDSVTFGSNKKVWWKGACGHEWETSVKARSNGEKCPICSGARVVTGINDLSTLKPKLASEWSEKNELKPTEVSVASHKKIIWKCKHGHEWEASVKSRTVNGTGCPYCSHNKVLAGFNDLASQYPNIAAESFNAEDKYAYDSRIVIEYHSIARRSVPISAKQAKGEQYQDIVEQLENAGFGNIIVSVDYDLITGWINGAGEVESISINGDAAFEQDSQYAVDAKIEIVYHDFKKNNPNK